MLSIAHFNVRFTPKWPMIVLFLLTASLFIKLGVWQLARAQQKKSMLMQFEQQQAQPPMLLANGIKPDQYQRLKVSGSYLNKRQFLLDNQHHAHQFGYAVLTPLLLDNGKVVMVDRGFIKGDITRRVLPEIDAVMGLQKLTGQTYYPSSNGLLLGPVIDNKAAWPKVIERIDLDLISKTLHKPVLGFIIRLDASQSHGYVRDWQIVSMPPERHKAYALQWFGLALAVFILFLATNVERLSEK